MKVVLAGGTGFIGTALRKKLLLAGHGVTVLTRKGSVGAGASGKFVMWDGKALGDWVTCFDGAEVVINLAGENIAAKRWTAAQKKKIVSSRVDATRSIVNAIRKTEKKPSLLINSSAIGFYGDVPEGEVTEQSPQGRGFLAETCGQWEAEALKAESLGVRVVLARLGPVLGEKGGMLSKMVPAFRLFLGGAPGAGRQWISWIHRDDVINIFLFLMENRSISGPVNIAAPDPRTMLGFCSALGKVLKRPSWLPVPALILKMLLGDMSDIVLSSQKAVPEKMLNSGYSFFHPELEEAFFSIMKK